MSILGFIRFLLNGIREDNYDTVLQSTTYLVLGGIHNISEV